MAYRLAAASLLGLRLSASESNSFGSNFKNLSRDKNLSREKQAAPQCSFTESPCFGASSLCHGLDLSELSHLVGGLVQLGVAVMKKKEWTWLDLVDRMPGGLPMLLWAHTMIVAVTLIAAAYL